MFIPPTVIVCYVLSRPADSFEHKLRRVPTAPRQGKTRDCGGESLWRCGMCMYVQTLYIYISRHCIEGVGRRYYTKGRETRNERN